MINATLIILIVLVLFTELQLHITAIDDDVTEYDSNAVYLAAYNINPNENRTLIFPMEVLYRQAIWIKQQSNLCYEGKDDKFGTFTIKDNGLLIILKLVYNDGDIECEADKEINRWGCDNKMLTVVTNDDHKILFPSSEATETSTVSTELTFKMDTYRIVRSNEILKVWFLEDLMNDGSEFDNTGQQCIDVYMFMYLTNP